MIKLISTLVIFFLIKTLCASTIATADIALTLARIEISNKSHVLLVVKQTGDMIQAIDLSREFDSYPEYALDIFRQQKDFNLFLGLMKNKKNIKTYAYKELLPAINGRFYHIGAAGNYTRHAEETSLENIFFFPKHGKIHPPLNSIKVKSNHLLDYEVELCVGFDRDIHSLSDFKKSIKGLFLCNDWSERTSIIKSFDSKHPELAGGLSDAKSKLGYYQAGAFLVVPYNWKKFLKKIQLSLHVNQKIRQNRLASKMVLSIADLVKMILKKGQEKIWTLNGKKIASIPKGYIEKGMTILTGTPEGVIFRPPSKTFIMGKLLLYIITGITGPFFEYSPNGYIREQYVKKLIRQKNFLQPGDIVDSKGTYLGSIKTQIIKF